MTNAQRVNDWLQRMEQEVYAYPVPREEVSEEKDLLIVRLIFEELAELAAALGYPAQKQLHILCNTYKDRIQSDSDKNFRPKSTVAILDALVDIEIVTHNATAFYGLSNNYQEAFERVMEANDRKIINVSKPYANLWAETQIKYNGEVTLSPGGVVKDRNGKVRKPAGWEDCSLEDLAYHDTTD